MDYSGTIYVKDSEGSDYLGVVFGYQSNRKFYVVMWRRENINFGKADTNAGIKGLQLKVRIFFSVNESYTLIMIGIFIMSLSCNRAVCNQLNVL